jgi:hypothetical protein
MPYKKNIEVYEQIANFRTPLAETTNKIADCNIGDFVIIINNEVWVRNWNNDNENEFSLAVYSPAFVRINTEIFKKA